VNWYGMSLHNQQRETASLSYGLAPSATLQALTQAFNGRL
jgi:hypothetical protein